MSPGLKAVVPAVLVALLVASVALAADPLDPKLKISKIDQASAVAALIVRSDLGPAWAGGARKPVALKLPVCPAYHPNDHDLTITGHAESLFSLASLGIQVDGDVEILKTAKQVETQFKRILQPKLATCLKYDLLKSTGGTGVTIGKVSRLPIVNVGTHAALFRVELNKGTVFADFMFLAQNRTEYFVNVIAPASAKSQLPALENRIASTIVKRARV